MARPVDDDPDMHIDLPARPQFPQGPSRPPAHAANAALETPNTPFSEGDPFSSPGDPEATIPHYSLASHYRNLLDDPNAASDKPPIPSALPMSSGIESTPLPKIPIIVLSIAVLGEFLSANVSTPFIVDMTRGFNLGDAAELGSYTGAIIASFFVTQFLTSLLWATVAAKHGNRAVLVIALTGNAITCMLFGTCTSFPEAIAVRLIQGIFNGAVGVARSTVTNVTDPSNESRAYGIMGFSWGLGGVAGAIIGGAFESPAKNWPNSFGRIPLFVHFPYLLPTTIAALILLIGAVLSCFLAWDGGPRQGAIQLPADKPADEERGEAGKPQAPGANINLGDAPIREDRTPSFGAFVMRKKVSGYFARRVREAYGQGASESPVSPPPQPQLGPAVLPRGRAASRPSRMSISGSAYGYRPRHGSQATYTSAAVRRSSTASAALRHRRSSARPEDESPSAPQPQEELTLAQRLLIANENTATSLPSLWVAAAINVDNEDPFAESEDEEYFEEEDEEDDGEASSTPGRHPGSPKSRRQSAASGVPLSRTSSFGTPRPYGRSFSGASARRPSNAFAPLGRYASIPLSFTTIDSEGPGNLSQPQAQAQPQGQASRRGSSSHVLLPAIYANTGVATPPALMEALGEDRGGSPGPGAPESLSPIAEGHVVSQTRADAALPEKQLDGFRWSALPLFIIFQYFVLALHSTSHDQVFLMYLTSDYAKGGLGLDPSHFATLIALMCVAQVVYQFYLYPNIGPPRGKFSHLAMFRIGSALFIPGYLTVVLYRGFASSDDDGNVLVMSLLALSTAIRYAGATFAYTSIAVLLNYMSPPHMVAFSNGLAQSLASLARVIGPLLGGWLWAESTKHGPAGFPFGFYTCSVLCASAIFLSFFIR